MVDGRQATFSSAHEPPQIVGCMPRYYSDGIMSVGIGMVKTRDSIMIPVADVSYE